MLICGVRSQSRGYIWGRLEIAAHREAGVRVGRSCISVWGAVVTVGAQMSAIVKQNAMFKLSARPQCVRSLKTWRVGPETLNGGRGAALLMPGPFVAELRVGSFWSPVCL